MRNFCVGGVLLDKQTPPLKGGSKDPRDYLQYGLSLSEQGQDQEAEENLRLAMDMDPQNGVFPMFWPDKRSSRDTAPGSGSGGIRFRGP